MAKTYKNLWPDVVSFENLLLAARKAQKGKRFKDYTARFNLNLEKELFRLRRELTERTYRPGGYKEFVIEEPVRRTISAAPYRDRVVHHALCNVIEPIFERSFIFDSYANRKGKGTHRAVDRFEKYLRQHPYVLKCDIRKYFPAIDHGILKRLVRKRIADEGVLWLVDTIIDGSNLQEQVCDYYPGDSLTTPFERPRGLPIGNLTSQFFGNLYLDGFDHFVKEGLGCRAYLRYVDDFAVFGNDKAGLWEIRERMAEYLAKLRLRLHPRKTRVFPAKNGCEFLGFYVYPHVRKLKKANVRLFQKRLKRMARAYGKGEVGLESVQASIRGWLGHACQAQSVALRERILGGQVFRRA